MLVQEAKVASPRIVTVLGSAVRCVPVCASKLSTSTLVAPLVIGQTQWVVQAKTCRRHIGRFRWIQTIHGLVLLSHVVHTQVGLSFVVTTACSLGFLLQSQPLTGCHSFCKQCWGASSLPFVRSTLTIWHPRIGLLPQSPLRRQFSTFASFWGILLPLRSNSHPAWPMTSWV